MSTPGINLQANIPIPDLMNGEECWIIASIAAVRKGSTKQGKPYYDAIAQNSTGRIAVKVWSDAIKLGGSFYPGLWVLKGRKSNYNDGHQFEISKYKPADIEQYRKHQGAEPPFPKAFTLDIETLPLPSFRERVPYQLKKNFQTERMSPDQRGRYLEDRSAEEIRAYKLGSLSAISGRILAIAVHIGPLPDFNLSEASSVEKVFGIDPDGKEQSEAEALTSFVDFIREFDKEADELVGHNIIQFDWPFILQRCLVHQIEVPPLFDLSDYHVKGMFDTAHGWWGGSRRMVGLDDIAWAFGIPSSKTEEVDGSQVFHLYEAGRLTEIREYNLNDVRLTRKIYERMINVMGRQ